MGKLRPCAPCACAIKYLFQAGGTDGSITVPSVIALLSLLSGRSQCLRRITTFLLILRVFPTPTK
jgi:hypothetical protein